MPPRPATGLEDPSTLGVPQMHPGDGSQTSNGGAKRPRDDDDDLDEDDDEEGGKKERKCTPAFLHNLTSTNDSHLSCRTKD